MVLSAKSRTTIYQALEPSVGSEALEEMLASFPSREGDEPATKDLVQVTAADLRTEMAELRTELKTEMAELRTDMAQIRTEIARSSRQVTVTLTSVLIAWSSLLFAVALAIRR